MADLIEFCLLGPLMVRARSSQVSVRGGKQRTLLAALLLNVGRVVSRDDLAEALWDAVPPPSARVTVQNYVMRLRADLGDVDGSLIATRPHGYMIRIDAMDVDVNRFESGLGTARAAARDGSWAAAADRACAALALWRGEPLADIDSEVLKSRERPRLAELRLQALETRIDADVHVGRHAEVIGELRQLTGAHPLRERLHALLMLALYRDGRQAEALAAYVCARRVLVHEVGVEPGTELCELQRRILTADPSLNVAIGPEPFRVGAALPRELPPAVRHFCGRTEELDTLNSLLGQAGERQPGALMISTISGMAGVGKTTS